MSDSRPSPHPLAAPQVSSRLADITCIEPSLWGENGSTASDILHLCCPSLGAISDLVTLTKAHRQERTSENRPQRYLTLLEYLTAQDDLGGAECTFVVKE